MSTSASKPDPTPVPTSEVRVAPAVEKTWDVVTGPPRGRAPAWLGEVGGENPEMDALFQAGVEYGDDDAAELAALDAGTHPLQRLAKSAAG